MHAMSLVEQPLGALLDSIAAKAPTPGGGAVACAVGALAAALGEMVVAYSLGRKNLTEHQELLAEAARELQARRQRLLDLAADDMAAYARLNEAMKLLAGDPAREASIAKAAAAATDPPLAVMHECGALLALFERLAGRSNRHLRSDLAIAAILTASAGAASRWNVRINEPLLETAAATAVSGEADKLAAEIGRRAGAIEQACLSE